MTPYKFNKWLEAVGYNCLKPKTFESEHYKNYVRDFPCCICEAPNSGQLANSETIRNTFAHIEMAGMGSKCSDFFGVSACGKCHQLEGDYTKGKIQFYIDNGVNVHQVALYLLASYYEQLIKGFEKKYGGLT